MCNIKAPLQAKIKTLISKIESNPHTLEESVKFQERFAPLLNKTISATKKLSQEDTALLNEYYSEKYTAIRTLALHNDELQALRNTMMLDLIKVESEWVITDSQELISPAGFHPTDRVVIRNSIMYFMDKRPTEKSIPRSNVQLFAHKMPPRI